MCKISEEHFWEVVDIASKWDAYTMCISKEEGGDVHFTFTNPKTELSFSGVFEEKE